MVAPTALWPRQALEAALEGEVAGLETMRLLLAQPDWVHRRVDALEYRDSTTFRRRQSVHFTVPETAPELAIGQTTARLIPLTTLRKETLVNFDCRDESGTERIVKFSYEELGDLAPEPWPRAPLAALCWIPRQAASAAESLFSAESYHFEGDMPAGIDVPVASLWVGATEDDMACVDLDTGGHLRIALRAAGFERGVAEVRWSLRPARRGWLRTAWIATSLSALTLAVGAWRIDTITAGTPDAATRTQLAAAVILTLIGTLGGLVARIEEHPLVSRLLEWPRRLAGVAALLPFLAAGTLVVGPAGGGRRVLWTVLAAVGVAVAGVFTVAFARPDTAADPPPPSGAGADGGG